MGFAARYEGKKVFIGHGDFKVKLPTTLDMECGVTVGPLSTGNTGNNESTLILSA